MHWGALARPRGARPASSQAPRDESSGHDAGLHVCSGMAGGMIVGRGQDRVAHASRAARTKRSRARWLQDRRRRPGRRSVARAGRPGAERPQDAPITCGTRRNTGAAAGPRLEACWPAAPPPLFASIRESSHHLSSPHAAAPAVRLAPHCHSHLSGSRYGVTMLSVPRSLAKVPPLPTRALCERCEAWWAGGLVPGRKQPPRALALEPL